MSSSSNPISPAHFALAIEDLPVSALHAKAAEIQNSLNHLVFSNEQLQPFAEEGDGDCADAIKENEAVMERFRERLALLRAEVEGRGMRWAHDEQMDGDTRVATSNGTAANGESIANGNGDLEQHPPPRFEQNTAGPSRSGTLSDEELATRMRQRLEDDEDDGVHL